MKNIVLSALILSALSSSVFALTTQDAQDYNETTKVGCISKTPVSEKANVYFVCWSRQSEEVAFNAVMYKVKSTCNSEKIDLLFNIPPNLPAEDGVYSVQMEASCGDQP